MKGNTLHLNIDIENDTIYVSISGDECCVSPIGQIKIHKQDLFLSAQKIIELFNKSVKSPSENDIEQRLREAGTGLFDKIFPPHMKHCICTSQSKYLIIGIHEELIQIPWELMYTHTNFLCRQFKIGRFIKTHKPVYQSPHRKLSFPVRMWIIANPQGDLKEASKEGLSIFQKCETNPLIQPTLDDDIPVDLLKNKIKSFDIVHFAGHAKYNKNDPSKSAWEFKDNNFDASHIYQMKGGAPLPSLIFTNACQRVKPEYRYKHGLAHSFVYSGVRHYIDTLWDILDEPASAFSQEFYTRLFQGLSVGESMEHARNCLIEKFGTNHLTWASYILYGDPRVEYIEQSNVKNIKLTARYILSKFKNLSKTISNILKAIPILLLILFIGFIFLEKSEYQENPHLKQIMLNKIKHKQKRTQKLFKELSQIGFIHDKSPDSDDWTSPTRTIGMIFDEMSVRTIDKRILYAIQKYILNQKQFFLAESESFDAILEQLIRKIKLKKSTDKYPLKLIIPDFLMFIELAYHKKRPFVFVKIADKNTGIVIKTLFESIENENVALLFKQLSMVFTDIKKAYPIRGRVVMIDHDLVHLNIGEISGVTIGQKYQVIKKQNQLNIVAVSLKASKGTVVFGKTNIQIGDRIENILINTFSENQ